MRFDGGGYDRRGYDVKGDKYLVEFSITPIVSPQLTRIIIHVKKHSINAKVKPSLTTMSYNPSVLEATQHFEHIDVTWT